MAYAVERTGTNDILRLYFYGQEFSDVRTSYAKADLAMVQGVLDGAGFSTKLSEDGKILDASIPGMSKHIGGTFYDPLTWDEVMTWAVDRVGISVCGGIISPEKADEMLGNLAEGTEGVF
jgi:hypothetical protein